MNENLYNILMIDDHPIVTDGLEKLLSTHIQAHCMKANDLNTLKQVLTGTDFNLCITDKASPYGNGFQPVHHRFGISGHRRFQPHPNDTRTSAAMPHSGIYYA